jgi:hypothetical protein
LLLQPETPHLILQRTSTTMAAAAATPGFDAPLLPFPIAGLSATSSEAEILRAVPDVLSFNRHKRHFLTTTDTSAPSAEKPIWTRLYYRFTQFGNERGYGAGQLETVYLHYRLRTLHRLTGECRPHPDERAYKKRESKKRRKAALKLNNEAEGWVAASSSQMEPLQPATAIAAGLADAAPSQPAVDDSMSDAAPPEPSIPIAASLSCTTSQQSAVVNGLADLPRYHDAHPETQLLNRLFSLYKKQCGLQHGADVDASNLPEKRSRKPPSPSGVATLPEPDLSIPPAVATGYAECTRKAFDMICQWLCESAPDGLRMGADSVFFDIGSGYGKCVVQARIRAGVHRSIGIEFVPARYVLAMEMLVEHIPGRFASIRDRLGGCVELLGGDATDEEFVQQYEEATHIFMFDWVFNAAGKEGTQRLIQHASNLRVLVCCQRPDDLPQFQKLHQMQLSTGKQSPTVYFYARRPMRRDVMKSSVVRD